MAGLQVAEELFEASSELTLEALAKVHASVDYRTLVLAFDRTLVWQTQGSPSARERFLRHYLWYWSGQDRPGANQFRSKMHDAAARRQGLLSECLSFVPTDPVISSLVSRFEQHLRLTLAKLKSTNCALTEPPDSLAFDYLHMNNNRPGVSPTEEAYIAAHSWKMPPQQLVEAAAHSVQRTAPNPCRVHTSVVRFGRAFEKDNCSALKSLCSPLTTNCKRFRTALLQPGAA